MERKTINSQKLNHNALIFCYERLNFCLENNVEMHMYEHVMISRILKSLNSGNVVARTDQNFTNLKDQSLLK